MTSGSGPAPTPINPCARRTLAAGDFALVEQCSCGAVHLTLGAVTLRLVAGVIPSLAATMEEAARRLLRDQILDAPDARSEIVS
jgi:hypothetical protein